ncbi:hypothetical protein [uncultured Hymenobacter sp.]|uniref:hypothetical protein n=1 Tax=uncultured Hymenobacter sp. TaxID=170016 RepID=UPI0035C9B3B7
MKILLFFLLLGMSSCLPRYFASEEAPLAPVPVPVKLDSFGQLSAGKVKFNGPVTIQHGQGNVASTTKTDNTGRAAESGANGGYSEAKQTTVIWPLVLCVIVGLAGGWLLRSRLAVLLVLLCLPLASQANELPEPKPRRYSYKEARRTERRYNQAVRHYKRRNRRLDKELAQDRKKQAKRLKQDHP